jgi:uncharacterized DUF497 family protein
VYTVVYMIASFWGLVCPPAEEGLSHADERLGRVDLEFEWDEEKRITNIKERGVDFRDAGLIFEGPVITKEDMRENYGEQRFRALGKVDDEYYVVAYTWRGSTCRIISAWRVDEEGKRRYEDILSR